MEYFYGYFSETYILQYFNIDFIQFFIVKYCRFL